VQKLTEHHPSSRWIKFDATRASCAWKSENFQFVAFIRQAKAHRTKTLNHTRKRESDES